MLDELPAKDRDRVSAAIYALGDQPRPQGVKKLRTLTQWRIRSGSYRVIYSIFDRDRAVVIDRIARRTTHTHD